MIDILLNKNNFIEEYNLISNGNSFGKSTIIINNEGLDLNHFELNFESYKYENELLTFCENISNENNLNKQKEQLRLQREAECFIYINRGTLWYATLSEIQLEELNQWYQDWLEVTETLKIPNKLEWL